MIKARDDLRPKIMAELNRAAGNLGAREPIALSLDHDYYDELEALGAYPDLLTILDSYGATQEDDWVLHGLRQWNHHAETGRIGYLYPWWSRWLPWWLRQFPPTRPPL